ncbi:two-component sensor histidine kinase [Halobacteriales archaeon QH_10_67_13]|nr:MAG: two-component sensor histidine kinase [Halobacteriales archaeon QH_10_67_13]
MCDEEQKQERLEEQRDDMRLLNQVMRHDIRNDLQLVQAYAELLDDHVDEAGREYLNKIKESAESAVGMTTTARDLAQVLLRSEEETEPVSLAKALDHQVEDVVSAYPEAVVRVDGSLPETEVTANDMLDSVFRNLLRNAIEHNNTTPPEGTVSATVEGELVTVEIADNGPGVPDSRKDEIFGKGEKGLESGGAGVGLYLVRSLVESYGGRAWVGDNDPEGAVFVLELPTV